VSGYVVLESYSQVVEFNMPSIGLLAKQSRWNLLGFIVLTIHDDKQIDSQNSEALADLVVGILEFSLHDCRIDFDDHDSSQASENHGPASPLIGKEFGRYGVGNKRASAVYARKSEDGGRVDPERPVENRLVSNKVSCWTFHTSKREQTNLIILNNVHSRQTCHRLYSDADKYSVSV
jgi:hypothetical protein